jgi:transcriptional regulator with XRE-family HTH domain
VNDIRIGTVARALRQRLGLRQADVGARARVSQDVVSLIERGQLERVSLSLLRRVLRGLDADLVLVARWRGGDVDRLIDERHAWLGGRVAGLLGADGWRVFPEVTYSIFGERGSIDLIAWHPETRTLLVIELKSELVSAEETLRRHDAKVRLAPAIVADRFGWRPVSVARLLVLPDTTTNRRRVERHSALFSQAYPAGNVATRRFIRRPSSTSSFGGLWFLSDTTDLRGIQRFRSTRRIRRRVTRVVERGSGA